MDLEFLFCVWVLAADVMGLFNIQKSSYCDSLLQL